MSVSYSESFPESIAFHRTKKNTIRTHGSGSITSVSSIFRNFAFVFKDRRMKKSLGALAFGTFGLGIAEFVMMGILPYLAHDFQVSIAEAGRFISAYALGVCVGAPLVAAFARKMPLKHIMYLLMAISLVTSIAMAFCPTPTADGERWPYYLMLVIRFLAGTPHGAFFSVGAIMADRLSKGEKATFAVAIVSLGMAIANLIGNPLCAWVTAMFTWRYIFYFTACWNLVTWVSIARWVPEMEALPDHGLRSEFRFLKSFAPWLLFVCTIMGNGGVFCWYSYISPTLTTLGGVPEQMMGLMLVLAGGGMVIGNILGGKLSDRFMPGRTGKGIEFTILVTLILIAMTTHIMWCAIPLMIVATSCLFAVSSPQQLLFVRHSKGGELMGGAMVQIAFNLGNAIGAWAGGLPINEQQPDSYHYPAMIGASFALIGLISYILFCRKFESRE